MIMEITQWILSTLRTHGGWSVFVGVLVEQVIIPIPSPAILMGAGLILIPADAGWLSALWKMTIHIMLPATLASTLGAVAGYYIALWGGRWFVDKFQKFLGFSWADVQKMSQHFSVRGEATTLFFMRALPIVPLSLVSFVAGFIKVPLRVFVLWSFLGTIPRCYILSILGWQLGSGAMNWAKGVNRLESLVSLALVLTVTGLVLYIRRSVSKEKTPS